MHALGFIKLMKSVYGRELPDLDWIQGQGLLAVKIAQHFALRIDFLDPDVCRHLARLYRNADAVAPFAAMSLLERQVPAEWFDEFRRQETE